MYIREFTIDTCWRSRMFQHDCDDVYLPKIDEILVSCIRSTSCSRIKYCQQTDHLDAGTTKSFVSQSGLCCCEPYTTLYKLRPYQLALYRPNRYPALYSAVQFMLLLLLLSIQPDEHLPARPFHSFAFYRVAY